MTKLIPNKPILLILSLTLSIFYIICGCATQPVAVKVAPVLTPKEIPSGQKAKPVQLKKVIVKIKRGTIIGSIQTGYYCTPVDKLKWKGGRFFMDIAELDEVFREEFESANYTVVGDPDALFDDPSSWNAQFLIGAIVADIDMRVCISGSRMKGWVYLEVNWQTYSRLDRKVVYKTTTEGSYEYTQFTDETIADLVLHAFGSATQNLLADRKFYSLVAGETAIDPPSPTSFNKLILAESALFKHQIEKNFNDVRMGVVTVFAGEAHGSGFFIDTEGHMLTSAHVVRDAKFVKIKLVTGREILGEVLRQNPRMDIALVKADEENMVPLPVNEKELNIGSPVWAIGSPLDQTLSSTVTRGVLSAYRTKEGMTFIQSDVNILPGNSGCPLVDQKGNAIGICVSGVFMGGSPAGLNFFVPINHALKALNIEMVAPAALESKRLLAAEENKTKQEAERHRLENEKPKVATIPKEVPVVELEPELSKSTLRKKWKVAIFPFHFESYADELQQTILIRTFNVINSHHPRIIYSYYGTLGANSIDSSETADVDTHLIEKTWQKESFFSPFKPDEDIVCEIGRNLNTDYIITGKVMIGPAIGSDYRRGGSAEIYLIDVNKKKTVNKIILSLNTNIHTPDLLLNYERSLNAFLSYAIEQGLLHGK